MAEALLRHHASDRFEALSGGLRPKEHVHPLALRSLQLHDVDTQDLRPKPSADFLGKVSITYAIVLCEHTQQECPRIFPFAMHSLYWPFDDPAAVTGTEAQQLDAFVRVRDAIEARIVDWLESQSQPG